MVLFVHLNQLPHPHVELAFIVQPWSVPFKAAQEHFSVLIQIPINILSVKMEHIALPIKLSQPSAQAGPLAQAIQETYS
jgi:hypothetical protein